MDNMKIDDHDLLIVVSTKLTQVSQDIKNLSDNLTGEVAAIKAKVIYYDQLIAEFPPKSVHDQLEKNTKWISDFKLTWRLMLALVLGLGGLVTWLLLNMLNFLKLTGTR